MLQNMVMKIVFSISFSLLFNWNVVGKTINKKPIVVISLLLKYWRQLCFSSNPLMNRWTVNLALTLQVGNNSYDIF